MSESAVPHTVVLVEGVSDARAVTALATRRDRNLEAEGVAVVPIGGAHALAPFLERFGSQGLGLRVAGLCDAGEEGAFARGLEGAGLGSDLTRDEIEALGFFVWSPIWRTSSFARSVPPPCSKSSTPRASSARSGPSRSSPRSEGWPWTSSCGASCGTGRSATRRSSSTHSTSAACPVRWMESLPTLTTGYDLHGQHAL